MDARNCLREKSGIEVVLFSMIVSKQSAVTRVLIFLSVFGCMFLFSVLNSAISDLVGDLLLVIVGVLFLVLAVFLARKYWSVIKPSI